MANMPMDIVNDVFLRLPATTLLRCRVLSKPCFSLIDSPDFVASHLKRTLETEEHIMLLLQSPRLLRTMYIDAPDKLSLVEHPLQTGGFTEVFGSVNGLIGLTNSPTDLAIFNPSTRKIHRLPIEPIEFPERSITRQYVFYGLGHDSVSDDYKVVRMVQCKHKDGYGGYPFEIKVFSLKSNRWKRIHLRSEVQLLLVNFYYNLVYRSGNGVLASNSFHWILPRSEGYIDLNRIIRFDLASDDLGVLSFPEDLHYEDYMDLGVLDGCLCLMCYSESIHVDVWILREYGGEWSKFISVTAPETVGGSFEFVRPLIYSKDKSKILLEINNGKLFWFDLASKSFERLEIKGFGEGMCNTDIVVSSLVLGCKGHPRRAQEKKMMQKGNKRRDDFLSKGFKLKL
nr:PREDICTED: F-box protein At4g22390-like isoform X1 [Raphanus sativus]